MRWLRRVLACVVLCVLFQGCATLTGAANIPCPPAEGGRQDGEITLLSWNIHGLPFTKALDTRMDNIADEILLCRPDVVLLQEAWLESIAARLESRLAAGYVRVRDSASVHAGLHGVLGVRRGGLLSFLRTEGVWRLEPPGSASLFETYTSSAPWYRISELDGVAYKGMQRFVIADGARRLIVVNTHLQAQYGDRRRYEEVREDQIAQLVNATRKSEGAAVVVAGDFNTNARERLYDALLGHFVDLTAGIRKSHGGGTHFGNGRETGWIDYLFATRAGASAVARDAILIKNSGEDDPFSDHHGIWMRLAIGR